MYKKILLHTTAHPRHLFAIDGAGALLSALLLALVLPAVQHLIGMPRPALYLLAAFPILFASYDAWCYLRLRRPHAPYLRMIGTANLLYCALSVGLLIYHFHLLTPIGMAYFMGELLIVLFLAILELRTATTLNTTQA